LAIQEAAKHDSKVVIEKGLISPQEIEMAVVGNSDLLLSEP
jgi:D-alanine-D-alanine ligase-like ATP-grasp enzyme